MGRMTGGALVALALLAAGVEGARAQGISIIPQAGAYIPASDFHELRDNANTVRLRREGTFALGAAVEMGWLRGSLAYATGATINEKGVTDRQDIGDGSVLTAAADLVWRPLPRVLAQPYLLGGIGLKNSSYNWDEGLTGTFPKDDTDTAVHVGVGADLMLGSFGLMAEVTDFISRNNNGDWGVHDAFGMVGLKFRVGH